MRYQRPFPVFALLMGEKPSPRPADAPLPCLGEGKFPFWRGELRSSLLNLPALAVLTTTLFGTLSPAFAQNSPPAPEGKKPTAQLFGFIEIQAESTDGNDKSRFFARRVRLGVKGDIDERWRYQILNDFAPSANNLQDAYVEYRRGAKSPAIRFGQSKLPYSFELPYPSEQLPLVERALVVDELTTSHDRDTGFSVRSAYQNAFSNAPPSLFAYNLGVYNGAGRDQSTASAVKLVAARIQYIPTALRPLANGQLSVGFSTRQGAVTNGIADQTGFNPKERERYGFEINYLNPHWRFVSEYLWGRNLDAHGNDLHREGYYITLGRRVRKPLELLLRYEGYTPNASALPEIHRTTAGVAYDITRSASWYLNYEFLSGSTLLTGSATPMTASSGLRFRITVRY